MPDAFKGWCDVREVSEAHVKAVERPDAEGRYLIYSADAHYAEVVRLMRVHPGLFDQPDVPINSPDGAIRARVRLLVALHLFHTSFCLGPQT